MAKQKEDVQMKPYAVFFVDGATNGPWLVLWDEDNDKYVVQEGFDVSD
jgi:hypothetical protein